MRLSAVGQWPQGAPGMLSSCGRDVHDFEQWRRRYIVMCQACHAICLDVRFFLFNLPISFQPGSGHPRIHVGLECPFSGCGGVHWWGAFAFLLLGLLVV